ncbi:DUF6191 domain-containing protein [Georgenia sp. SUBG003]|uniref:DUF6191 domain-containing protein n=1 Tax=Georgenia sp. SUBG003 TaxID=1497974 RepID=UPI0005BD7AD2
MSEFFMIFEPGLRHLVEERKRQKMDIRRPGDGAPPFGPVDLDSGVVYLDAGEVPGRRDDGQPRDVDHDAGESPEHRGDGRSGAGPGQPQ